MAGSTIKVTGGKKQKEEKANKNEEKEDDKEDDNGDEFKRRSYEESDGSDDLRKLERRAKMKPVVWKTYEYKVKQGDTCESIAKMYGVSIKSFKKSNKL